MSSLSVPKMSSDTVMSSEEDNLDTMPLDVFFQKIGADEYPDADLDLIKLKRNGFTTVHNLRTSNDPGGWRSRMPKDLLDLIDSNLFPHPLSRNSPPNDNSPTSDDNSSEPKLDEKTYSVFFEKWKVEVTTKVSNEKENPDSPFNFGDQTQILNRQKQFYVGLEDNIIPYSENDVTECNMLYGFRYDRKVREDEEPVFVRLSSQIDTKVRINSDQSLSDVLSTNPVPGNPLYVVVQQRGAGKTFEIYSTAAGRSRTSTSQGTPGKFVLFFNMSTGKESSDVQTKSDKNNSTFFEADAVNPAVASYYDAVRKVMSSRLDDDVVKYNKTVSLTFKLVYAAIFHFAAWRAVHPNDSPVDWFRYSFRAKGVLNSIFRDILSYTRRDLREIIQKNSDNFKIRELVLSFDEAGELTTDRPVNRCFLPRRRSGQNWNTPRYSLFHPFIDALLRMSNLEIRRVVSGTGLDLIPWNQVELDLIDESMRSGPSLSHVSLGMSSAVKPEEISLLMITSLFRTRH